MLTQPGNLTDREIFATVAARAIQGVICGGVAALIVIGLRQVFPLIGEVGAVLLLILFLLSVVWTLWIFVVSTFTTVLWAVGALDATKPFDPHWLWAAQGARCAESAVYLSYAYLLYRLVLIDLA